MPLQRARHQAGRELAGGRITWAQSTTAGRAVLALPTVWIAATPRLRRNRGPPPARPPGQARALPWSPSAAQPLSAATRVGSCDKASRRCQPGTAGRPRRLPHQPPPGRCRARARPPPQPTRLQHCPRSSRRAARAAEGRRSLSEHRSTGGRAGGGAPGNASAAPCGACCYLSWAALHHSPMTGGCAATWLAQGARQRTRQPIASGAAACRPGSRAQQRQQQQQQQQPGFPAPAPAAAPPADRHGPGPLCRGSAGAAGPTAAAAAGIQCSRPAALPPGCQRGRRPTGCHGCRGPPAGLVCSGEPRCSCRPRFPCLCAPSVR